jgi:hypothetical protein
MTFSYTETKEVTLSEKQIKRLREVAEGGDGWSPGESGEILDSIAGLGLVTYSPGVGAEIYYLTTKGEKILAMLPKQN